MKKIISLVVVLALCIGGFYAYKKHQRSELLAQITPMVKNASIRVTNSTKFDTEPSHITYKELFDHIEADTGEIEKRSIDMQSIATAETAEVTSPAITYLRDCQEVSRALSMKYRKQLAFSNAQDRFDDALRDLRNSNSYGLEYAKQRSDRAVEEIQKARTEALESLHDLVGSAKKLKTSRAKLAASFPDDTLVPAAQIDALIAKNAAKDEKAKAEPAALKQ